jgi:hypothetical protein
VFKTGFRKVRLVRRRVRRILSLGVGVQSSTLALMAARGDIAPIDAAVFSDTKRERKKTYRWLRWLRQEVARSKYPFEIHEVSRGDLAKGATTVRRTQDGERTYIETAIPVFTVDGLKKGMGQRHCTRDYKVAMVERQARKILGLRQIGASYGVLIEMLIGISTDEALRMKPNRQPWIKTSWPLIDELSMSRADCAAWLWRRYKKVAPRSSCIWCPFHNDDEWLALEPAEFLQAVRFEKKLQVAYAEASEIVAVPYLHSSRVPLDKVVFKSGDVLNKYNNECEGFCGV